MKKIVFIILSLFFITCCFSCSNDDDNPNNYTKVKLEGSHKCGGEDKKEEVKNRSGIVVLHEEKQYIPGYLTYLKDGKNQYYMACTLPEEYQKNGLEILFSGIIYTPDPLALTINPLRGVDFEITELWVKK